MKNEIILIGGGGHCKAVIDVIEQEAKFTIAGIIDRTELLGQKVLGYEIIGCDSDLNEFFNIYKYAFISVGHIGSGTTRVKLYQKLKQIGYILPSIISPFAYVSKHAHIGEGSTIMHHALINAGASIGHNCIINTKALIEHDSVIEDHCHISTAAVINGGVEVKEGSFIGSNATTKQGIEISGFIKAGSIVK